MRRQVKPFVTEYRGSPRRSTSGDLQPEAQAPRSRSFAEAERAFHAEAPEDSYEAALRAADALFAPSSSDAVAVRGEPVPPKPLRDSADTAAASEAFIPNRTPASHAPSVERESTAPPRRILQAIEPPSEDRFAALEAERTPKRRGRKPGSKNKPKIVVGDDWSTPAARPAAASAQALALAQPVMRSPNASVTVPVIIQAPTAFAAEPAKNDTGEAEVALPQPRGRNDKFGWKRDGLRPGERWKRRLPKSAR